MFNEPPSSVKMLVSQLARRPMQAFLRLRQIVLGFAPITDIEQVLN